jgi:ankyrin repeat protein
MDPLSIIGGFAATAQIAGGIVQMIKNLNDARIRFKAADTTIKLLVSELLSVKAAVGQIEDWAKYNSGESAMPLELVEAFKVSFEACHLAMEILAGEVVALVSRNPFLARAGIAWNEATMKEHADRLRSQVSALQLLIQAVHCHNPRQQKDLMEKPKNRSIIQQVADDTSTLRASRRHSQFATLGSGPPTIISNTNSTVGSTIFDMDQDLVNTQPYQRARKHQQSKSFNSHSHNPFLRPSTLENVRRPESPRSESITPESPHSVFPTGPPPTSPTIITTSTEESRADSGFYDQDAAIVNPERYREAISRTRAQHNRNSNNMTRSVSDPQSQQPEELSNGRSDKDQLTPMERFRGERFKPPPSSFDPIESHQPVRPMRHVSVSDSNIYKSKGSLKSPIDVKRSPWGTLRRLTSRAALASSSSSLALSPGSTSSASLRPSPRSVKRRSEPNIHQSIDFTTEDGLSAPLIVRAAQSGSRMEIDRLLEQHVDIEERHAGSGRTALAVASHCGNDDVVAVLLYHRAQVEATDVLGMAPLHLAAIRGHYRAMQFLLRDHADVDACAMDNKTPLRLACDGGHLACVELLLEHRAKVNARDQHMVTALHAAAKIGDVQIVELLIQNGADKEAKDAILMNAMHYAAEGDYDDVVEKLLSYRADIESIGAQGKSPLSCACASGAHQTAALLIARKANHKHKADGDMTPLHFACQHDRADTADLLLLQKRVSIDARDSDGRTPLHLAAINKSFSAAELLLRRGAAIEAQCHRTLRPIHYACDKMDQTMLGLLLGSGAFIEAATHEGWRPIHFAAGRGSEVLVDTLARKGAQIDIRNIAGERALCIASARGHLSVVKVLLRSGSAMRLRVPKGPSLEDSPLCKAARYGHVDVVAQLLKRGASFSQPDEANWSPLRYAAYYGHAQVVEVLMMAGASCVKSSEISRSSGESVGGAARFGFADDVDPARRAEVMQWLNIAEERERTQPRRVGEYDPFLTIPTANGGRGREIYEVG